jgi:MFS family permease
MNSTHAAVDAAAARRRWWICGLLLGASMINYMDRQTLANAAVRISNEFQLSQEQYGSLELGFGWAFAVGSLVFGILADRVPVRWLYPAVLGLWSVCGLATSFVKGYEGLLVTRTLLGFFEAAHWPCGLRTTQALLESKHRAMGNSVLQSGTSIGAIFTPLVMGALMTEVPESWRLPFLVIGAAGLVWIAAWLMLVRAADVPVPDAVRVAGSGTGDGAAGFWRLAVGRRFLTLVLMVVCINTTWQLLRAWMPKFLMQGRGYAEGDTLLFTSLYYVATDVGCLGAGALTLWLHRRGRSVDSARSRVFLLCAALTAFTVLAAQLPKSGALLALLLVVGAGALGLFPCYYAWSQELSRVHQGKITGLTGVFAWAVSAPVHTLFGRLVDRTGSFDVGLAVVGCLPLVAFAALVLLWRDTAHSRPEVEDSGGKPSA